MYGTVTDEICRKEDLDLLSNFIIIMLEVVWHFKRVLLTLEIVASETVTTLARHHLRCVKNKGYVSQMSVITGDRHVAVLNPCVKCIHIKTYGQGMAHKSRPLFPVPNFFFLFLNQNICCGYSKEPSR